MYICMHADVFRFVCTYVYVYVCLSVCPSVCLSVCMYVYICTGEPTDAAESRREQLNRHMLRMSAQARAGFLRGLTSAR